MVRYQLRLTAAVTGGVEFEFLELSEGGVSGLLLSSRSENFLQGKDLLLGNKHTGFPVAPRVMTKCPRFVNRRDKLDFEFEAKAGDTLARPSPQSAAANGADHLRGLIQVEVTLAVSVDERRVLVSGHPRKEHDFEPDFKQDLAETAKRHPCDQADGFYE